MPAELARVKETTKGPAIQPVRCWDGILGCEQTFDKGSFKAHPLLCDRCADGVALRFGISRSKVELMTLLIAVDAGLYRSAAYLKADQEKIRVLESQRDRYLRGLYETIAKIGEKDSEKHKTTMKNFREWFYDQAGIEKPKPKAGVMPKGIVTPAEVLG